MQQDLINKQQQHRMQQAKQRQNSVAKSRELFEQNSFAQPAVNRMIKPNVAPKKPTLTNKVDTNNNANSLNRPLIKRPSPHPVQPPQQPKKVEQDFYEITNSQETYEIPGEDEQPVAHDSGYGGEDFYIEPHNQLPQVDNRPPVPPPGRYPMARQQTATEPVEESTYEMTDHNGHAPIPQIPAKPKGMSGQEFIEKFQFHRISVSKANSNPPSLPPQRTIPPTPPVTARPPMSRPTIEIPLEEENNYEATDDQPPALPPMSSHPSSRNNSTKSISSNSSFDNSPGVSMRDRPLPSPQSPQEDYEMITHSQVMRQSPRPTSSQPLPPQVQQRRPPPFGKNKSSDDEDYLEAESS